MGDENVYQMTIWDPIPNENGESNSSTTSQNDEKQNKTDTLKPKNYLTKDNSEIDTNLILGMYYGLKSLKEKGKDTFTLKEFTQTLIDQFYQNEIPDNTHLHGYLYRINFPNIVFLEKLDSDNLAENKYKILEKEFNEFVDHCGLYAKKIKAEDSVETIANPEISSEEKETLYFLLKSALSKSTYFHHTDNSTDVYHGEQSYSIEPLVTEVLKVMGLNTYKYRWVVEKYIIPVALNSKILDVMTVGKKQQYFIHFAFNVPDDIDNKSKIEEIESNINKMKDKIIGASNKNTQNTQNNLNPEQ